MKALIEKCARALCVVLALLLAMSALTLAAGAETVEVVLSAGDMVFTTTGEWRISGYPLDEPMGEAERRHFLQRGKFVTEDGNLISCSLGSDCPVLPIPPVGTKVFEKMRCQERCCKPNFGYAMKLMIPSEIAKRERCDWLSSDLHRRASTNMAEYDKAFSQYSRDMEKWVRRVEEKRRVKKVLTIIWPIVAVFLLFLVVFCGKAIIKDWKARAGVRAKNRIRRCIEKENARILREEEERELTKEVMREMNDGKGKQ